MVRKIVVALLSFQIFAGISQAAPGPKAGFEAGPYVSRITYEEPGTMKNTGTMYGVDASATWRGRYLSVFDYFRIDALAGLGSVDYTSVSTGSMSGVDDTMIEARALFGRDLSRNGPTRYSTFTGFGYRRLTDNSGGRVSTTGKLGYDRESQYLYLPTGMTISSDSGAGWSFDGLLEYDILLKGIQKSAFSEIKSTSLSYSNDLVNDQYNGYGIKVSAKFSKPVSHSTNLAFEPFLRYWNIGESRAAFVRKTDSNVTTTEWYVEPANSTTEYGMNVLLIF